MPLSNHSYLHYLELSLDEISSILAFFFPIKLSPFQISCLQGHALMPLKMDTSHLNQLFPLSSSSSSLPLIKYFLFVKYHAVLHTLSHLIITRFYPHFSDD